MKLHKWFKPHYYPLLIFMAGVIVGLSTTASKFVGKLLYLLVGICLLLFANYFQRKHTENHHVIEVGRDD